VNNELARSTGIKVFLGAYLAAGLGASCGGRPLEGDASTVVTPPSDAGAGTTDVSVPAPPDGRCGLSPKLLVAASTYPRPADLDVSAVGVWKLVPAGGDLFYETWALGGGLSQIFLPGSLMRVPVTGGSATQIASGYDFFGLIITESSVFVERENAYPNMDMDDVVSIPRAGGPPTILFTFTDINDHPIGGLAWDGEFVYVSSTAAVRAIPVADPTNLITVRSPGANGIQVSGGRWRSPDRC
jgi:hypothetical protein